jgi:Asp-tRNA(Asn)/Glu-tRNA(Gln) amidotransferase A subunit family amidase
VKSVRQTALDVQHGDASALSVLEESLARIRARNEELNVFLYVDEEGARAAANAID